MTKQEAIELSNSGWWKKKSAREIADFQLSEPRLCCPFDIFHKAVEESLGRSVWTHEFASTSELLAELHGENKQRTIADVIKKAEDLVGKDKVIIVREGG